MNKSLKSVLALCVVGFNLVGCLQLAEEDKKECPKCDQNVAGASATGGSSAVGTSSPATGGNAPVAGSSATGGDASTGGSSTLKVNCAAKFPSGLASPVQVDNASQISFAAQYLPAGSKAYAVGSLPGTTWNAGVQMSKVGDRFTFNVTRGANFVPGIYAAQYVSNTTLVNNTIPSQYFSPFGTVQDQVACYSAEDKAFIWCNMKDGAINGCEFRFYIDATSITGAGNLPLVPAGQLF